MEHGLRLAREIKRDGLFHFEGHFVGSQHLMAATVSSNCHLHGPEFFWPRLPRHLGRAYNGLRALSGRERTFGRCVTLTAQLLEGDDLNIVEIAAEHVPHRARHDEDAVYRPYSLFVYGKHNNPSQEWVDDAVSDFLEVTADDYVSKAEMATQDIAFREHQVPEALTTPFEVEASNVVSLAAWRLNHPR